MIVNGPNLTTRNLVRSFVTAAYHGTAQLNNAGFLFKTWLKLTASMI